MSYDPISQDPPVIDKAYPATMKGVLFESDGAKLNGIMYMPQGADPHPTILLLHGFPGHERNFDLAQIFRRAGYNVMVFHYRGAWGSEGDFRFSHILDDTEAALHYLRSSEAIEKYYIDVEQIIVIGHSMGGWAALQMAGRGLANRIASIAGANLGFWGELVADSDEARQASHEFFHNSLSPLAGVTADALLDELIAHMDDFDTMQLAKTLNQLDVLLIAGERDDDLPPSLHHTPLVTLLEKKNAENLTHVMLDADHGFSDKRIALARVLLDWLDKLNLV